MKVFLNDRILQAEDAKISIFDHGFLYGDGIFETVRAYNGIVYKLDEHLQRLFRCAKMIGLNLDIEKNILASNVYKTLNANKLSDAYIRITVTRGEGPIGIDPSLCKKPTLLIITQPFKPYPESYFKSGIRMVISKIRKNLKEALDPRIKSLNFLTNILANMEAKGADAVEAIMMNSDNYIAEGTVSNVFFCKDNKVYTPSLDCGVLDGITRSTVIDIAGRKGLKVVEGQYSVVDIYGADEVFITNTTMEIMPVGQLDDTVYTVGDITKSLRKEYITERNLYRKSE